MLALWLMTGVVSRFFTGWGRPAWQMYFTAWKRFAPLGEKFTEIAFFNHELFFWQNIKTEDSNPFHRFRLSVPPWRHRRRRVDSSPISYSKIY
jgi:hypothetical protein